MVICRAKDYKELSRKAANIISAQVIMKPDCVLGLATGSSPVGTYEQLIEWYKKGDLDFSKVSSINLDEYKGLDPENDQSYRYFMNTHLFDKINIDKKNTYVPDGLEPDKEKAVEYFQQVAEKEDPAGWCALGQLYQQGEGVDRDFAKAVEYYEKMLELDPENEALKKYVDNLRKRI